MPQPAWEWSHGLLTLQTCIRKPGSRRSSAFGELHKEGLHEGIIPAILLRADATPDELSLAELAENLKRTGLKRAQIDAFTLTYAGLVKKLSKVVSAKEANKQRGGRPSKNPPTASRSVSTTTEKVAKDLGVDKDSVTRRVRRATASIGVTGVTVEDAPADTLIKAGEQARNCSSVSCAVNGNAART